MATQTTLARPHIVIVGCGVGGLEAAHEHYAATNILLRLAWLFWLFAHVYFLIGSRNRLVVLLDWASAYWSFQRYARVVTGITPRRGEPPDRA